MAKNENRLNKQELINLVHAEMVGSGVEITKKAVSEMLNNYFDNIQNAVVRGERVVFTNFGSFQIQTRSGRQGRNPKTQEVIFIESKNVVKYSAGKTIKDTLASMPLLDHAKRSSKTSDDVETDDVENAEAVELETA